MLNQRVTFSFRLNLQTEGKQLINAVLNISSVRGPFDFSVAAHSSPVWLELRLCLHHIADHALHQEL